MTDEEPRAYTADEMRSIFLGHLRCLVDYWANLKFKLPEEFAAIAQEGEIRYRMEGLIHSVLVTIDGCTNLPAFDLVPSPHPEDQKFHEDEGSNWWTAEALTDNIHLHDLWHKDHPWRGKQPHALQQAFTAGVEAMLFDANLAMAHRDPDGVMKDDIARAFERWEKSL